MSPQDYEYLLMALDLARMDKRWGFSILVMKWKVFLEGYLFSTINCDCDGTFEVDRKKMDIDAFIQGESSNKRKDIAFIRIGVLHAKSPRKIEMQKGSDGLMIVILARDLLLLDLDIVEDDRSSVAVASPSRIPSP
jgi:hypothetical protein